MAKKKEKAKEEPEAKEDDAPAAEGAEGGEGGDAPKKKKLSGRTIVLFIALPAVAGVLLGGAGAYFFLCSGKEEPKDAHAQAQAEAEHAVFFDMPELLVNMTGAGEKQQNFLKLSLSLELPNADATPKVQAAMPRIIDSAQVFLR